MIFARKLVLVCLKHNILFKAKHISGFKNTLADAVSRLEVERFKKLAPVYMDPMATAIPSHLPPANWHLSAGLQKSSVPTYCRAWKLNEEF